MFTTSQPCPVKPKTGLLERTNVRGGLVTAVLKTPVPYTPIGTKRDIAIVGFSRILGTTAADNFGAYGERVRPISLTSDLSAKLGSL